MLVSASPTAMRPEAGASISASGVRSPIAMASPRVAVEAHQRHARRRRPAPATGRPSDRAQHRPPTVRSPIVIEERLVGHRRHPQHAIGGFLEVDPREIERRAVLAARARRRASSSAACRAARRGSMSTGIVLELRDRSTTSRSSGVARADDRERTALALAHRAEALEIAPARIAST